MIEAKNSELKHQHGYDVASSSDLIDMQMQGALNSFFCEKTKLFQWPSFYGGAFLRFTNHIYPLNI